VVLATSERQLLVYLRGLGLVQELEALVVSDPLDRLVADFVEYLVRERGLAVGSHKQDRHERIPLPSDVGDALVDYLRHGRPDRRDSHLFLTARAPFGPLTGGAGAIGMLVRSASV
jgi:hypothetical protein